MSNSGFVASLEEAGMKCVQTTVGDRFVYECMQENDYALGGEQSGHIIMKKYATTGDGILTAIMLTEELCDSKRTLSSLAEPVVLYPQYTRNIEVKDKNAATSDSAVLAAVAEVEKSINKKGRALLRKSGTEPVVRIMIECESEEKCVEYADDIARVIAERGHCVE
jgi:phosphoglucosamine mutase